MTQPVTTVALVGAGSVVFTRDLAADILRFPELREVHLALHDIDPERLAAAEAIVAQVARQVGAHPTVTAHLDRRAALAGADFVFDLVQVGGIAATRLDFEIPARYGLRQTIADTIGVGGIFRHLRTAPLLEGLARDMLELCPDAWLLNYTNPMSMNVAYLHRVAPRLKVLGMCHSVHWTVHDLCELVGVPMAEVAFRTAGVNHQAWLLEWTRDGESLYPLLDARIAADPELARRVRVDLYRRIGYYPTETSEHSSEYVPWYLHSDAELERLRIPVDDYLRISEENVREYEETRVHLAAGGQVPLSDTTEYAPQVVHSLVTGTPRRIVVTVPNDGLITNLPAEAAVEVPADLGADGVRLLPAGELPPQCAAVNRAFLGPALLAVEAAVIGDPLRVRQAVMVDPNAGATLTLDAIWRLCDELTAAHGEALPEPLRRPVAALTGVGSVA